MLTVNILKQCQLVGNVRSQVREPKHKKNTTDYSPHYKLYHTHTQTHTHTRSVF